MNVCISKINEYIHKKRTSYLDILNIVKEENNVVTTSRYPSENLEN